MKLLVVEKDRESSTKVSYAIKFALRLSKYERLPVYLHIGNKMMEVLPWDREEEIEEKFNVNIGVL